MAGEAFEGADGKKETTPVTAAAAAAPPAAESAVTGSTTTTTPTTTEGTEEVSAPAAPEGTETKPAGDDEDTGAVIAPIIKLEEVAISTGEENEEVLLDLKSKLYRFDKEGNQWKERGVGQVKLLQHKESEKIRLLMRQGRTHKICANHLITPATSLQEHAGSEKSWVWHASDYSDGELKEELFCIRLGNVESAQKFRAAYEEAQEKAGKVEKPAEEVDEAADALGGLSVGAEKPSAEADVPK